MTYFYMDIRDRDRAKKYALNQVRNNPIYKGVVTRTDDAGSDARRLARLVMQLLAAGNCFASLVFGLEIITRILKNGKLFQKISFFKRISRKHNIPNDAIASQNSDDFALEVNE